MRRAAAYLLALGLAVPFMGFSSGFSSGAAAEPQRVVAVGGAITEIVYALGAQNLLVGTDTTGYWPPPARALPKVGYQRTLSAEGILSLRPNLLIVTEQAGPPAVLQQVQAANVALLALKDGRSLDDVEEAVQVLAAALNRRAAGAELRRQLAQERAALQRLRGQASAPPRVLFLMHHGGGPPLVAGRSTAADSIIALSGGENVVQEWRGYKPLTPEAAVALAPDILLTTTQSLEQSGGEAGLLRLPGVGLTPAGKRQRVIAMDALLLLGFGPRTARAAMDLHRRYQKP